MPQQGHTIDSSMSVAFASDSGVGKQWHTIFTSGASGVYDLKVPAGAQFAQVQASVNTTYAFYAGIGDTVALGAPSTSTASITTDGGYGSGNVLIAGQTEVRIPAGAAKMGVYAASGTTIIINWSGA